MSDHDAAVAHDFPGLVRRWENQPGSKGGWWALAGFSFQAAVYLEKFFRGLHANGSARAEFERLSDLCEFDSGCFRLIQVKRRLDLPALRSALREAYRIAVNCDSALLNKLRFQIACQERATPKDPADISHTDVLGTDADSALWQHMLAQFDRECPIVESLDPIDRLHYLLWECGVQDTLGFLNECWGKLLHTFYSPDSSRIAELAQELAHRFRQTVKADKSDPRLGKLLRHEEFSAGEEAEDDHKVVVKRRPSKLDLRRGRYRHRDQIFADLMARFKEWWADVLSHPEAEDLQILWIDGRGGDGKSVLMLQLVQHLLAQVVAPVLVELSPDEVPDWIASQGNAERLRGAQPQRPTLGVIDDLHAVADLDKWNKQLSNATTDHLPRVALLTCGPTPDREIFENSCRTSAKITTFHVPHLTDVEAERTIAWFRARTGREPPQGLTRAGNRPFVVLIFELMEGELLGDFAAKFRDRLKTYSLNDVAREILAFNALELAAPEKILDHLSNRSRDYFYKLCESSQRHFERVALSPTEPFPGYRLAHPQISWQLYQEWTQVEVTSLARVWARDLANVLDRCCSTDLDAQFPRIVLGRLGISSRLAEAIDRSNVGLIQDGMQELYRQWAGAQQISMVQQWLAYLYRWPDLVLYPDPVQQACAECSGFPPPPGIHSSVGAWLWRLSETPRFAERAEEMRCRAQALLFGDPTRAGTGASLTTILMMASDRTAATRLVKDWLGRFQDTVQACEPLCALVANDPQDSKVLAAARAWVGANLTHDRTDLLAALVANHPQDDNILAAARAWVEANTTHDKAYQILSALVASHPKDDKILAAARGWVEANPTHDKAYQLLSVLVATHPEDDKFLGAALTWINAKPDHDRAYWLLNALVASRPKVAKVIDTFATIQPQDAKILADTLADILTAALAWVEDNADHAHANQLLAALVANWPEADDVWQVARGWWDRNSTNPNAYNLLSSLITRSDGAPEWLLAGETWVNSAGASGDNQVLAALLSGGKAAPRYLDMALARLERVEYSQREFIRYHLSRCLANNLYAGLEYLRNGSETKRKELIAKSLAAGLKRYPNRAEEFVENMGATPFGYQGLLLAGCIQSEMYGAILDCVVEDWLAQNYRRRGYGSVLHALKDRPARWQELLERNNLYLGIIADFDAQLRSGDRADEANAPTLKRLVPGKKKRRNKRKRERAKASSPPESDLQ